MVEPVSSWSSTASAPSLTRLLGSMLAAGLVFAVFGLGLSDDYWPIGRDTAVAGVPLAAILGWVLAARAAWGDRSSALAAALAFDFVAVPIGSLGLAAVWMLSSITSGRVDPAEGVRAAAYGGVLGWIFFGIPMLVVGLVIALVWVGLLRGLVRVLRLPHSPAA
jgi:hypothetical protein